MAEVASSVRLHVGQLGEDLTKVHQPWLLRLCWFRGWGGGGGVYYILRSNAALATVTYLGVSDLFKAPGQMDRSVAGFVLLSSSGEVET